MKTEAKQSTYQMTEGPLTGAWFRM